MQPHPSAALAANVAPKSGASGSAPRGVFCATATPLSAELEPDTSRLVAHCTSLLEAGCDGVAPLGTTGEANSFSVAERRRILDALVDGGIPTNQILPGTGAASLPDAIELTRHAVASGVGAVIVLPPFYYKTISPDGLYDFYARLFDQVALPELKVVLYHIPQMSQVPIPMQVIERLLSKYPSTIVGIKDSSGDLENMKRMTQAFPELAVLSGPDPLLLPLLQAGGAGCVTATSNFAASDLAYIFKYHGDVDRAAEVQAAQQRLVVARDATMTLFPHISSVKAVLASRTGYPGWRRVRPPLTGLTDDEAVLVNDAVDRSINVPLEEAADVGGGKSQ